LNAEQAPQSPSVSSESQRRFGTFAGVFTPSVLTILGVIMYLRMGWVVGNAGLGGALVIIGLAHLISIASGLSIASIATNRTVRGGGAYYMISRSLGAPLGAAIGLPLFVAQALSVTFYIVGFAEALSFVAPELDVRLVGSVVLLVLAAINLFSAELAIKVQYVIMALIVLSLISFFAGTGEAPTGEIVWFVEDGKPLAVVFAVFFPAVTGIMAGVSMSGDLKDPRRSLPKGTILAILAGLACYIAIPVWLSLQMSVADLADNNFAMWEISRFQSLVYLGVWGATLSSAVGSIMGAPRTLQALAKDRLAPAAFAKGHGSAGEPRTAMFFTLVLAEAGILMGSLDVLAPILTMFFLATYGVTNLACGLERWAASPSFRPTFRVPSWVSLVGALACFYVMSIIHLPAMVAAIVVSILIFVYTQARSPGSWGDARHGIWSAMVRMALLRLRNTEYHPRNWRPNLVIFGGDPNKRVHLLELGCMLVQERGVVTYFYLKEGDLFELASERRRMVGDLKSRFSDSYPNVLYRVEVVDEVYSGGVAVAQSYGMGSFETNAVMLGWAGKEDRRQPYVQMLRQFATLDCSLFLVRQKPLRGLGGRSRIDVWWGGMKGNGGLMLLLAFLLQTHDSWKGAHVRVITVRDDPDEVELATVNLGATLTEARMDAEACVLARGDRSIGEVMEQVSSNSDLAIVGLRLPEDGEDIDVFFERTNAFLSVLPTTIMVYSARDFEGEPMLFDD
jgi:amino acid transporter